MEDLQAFRKRTAFVWEGLPGKGGFATNPRLTEKVDEAGRFRPFFGDTVIFDLSGEDKTWLGDIQRALYAACGHLLAEPLDPASFHITLHDLNSGVSLEAVAPDLARSGEAARALLAALPGDHVIRVRSTAVFSMVHTSVVLGFEPADEGDCAALLGLYEKFQRVVPLSYPLMPHVTLAYYRPMTGGEDVLFRLREAIGAANRGLQRRAVRLSAPHYRTFTDMNHYEPADA